jgi:hypothetical protein
VGRSELWDVLRVERFKSRTFSDVTFCEWDVSRAGRIVMGRFESGTFQKQDLLYVHQIFMFMFKFISFNFFFFEGGYELCVNFIFLYGQ